MNDQKAAVLRLLRSKGADGLSAREARDQLGCDRLAARVCELRAEGHRVDTLRERSKAGATFARYVIHEGPAFHPVTGVQEGLAL